MLDDPRMLTVLDHEGRRDVAEPVEGESRIETGTSRRRREGPRREAAAKRCSLRPCEDEVISSRSPGPCEMRRQLVEQERRRRQRATRRTALGVRDLEPALNFGDRL